jgi:carbonic anhydrase/acetyltransferase-like protein (isoleucine patch superfamily)
MMRAVLIATGYHEEMKLLLPYRPSPLLRVVDRPILVHIIEYLVNQGVEKFNIVLHYLPERIEEYIGNGQRWGVEIHYHLAKELANPFAAIKPLAMQWEKEEIILGLGDMLPRFPQNLSSIPAENEIVILVDESDVWTGWGLFSSDMFKTMLNSLSNARADLSIFSGMKIHKIQTQAILSGIDFDQFHHSNIQFLISPPEECMFPSSARMIEPGIWISRAVSLMPETQILPPVFIGEHCQIKKGAQIGPNAIIENNCIVDSLSVVENSLVCQGSYIGEGLEIRNSIIKRNLLINLSLDTCLIIKDNFMLSGLAPISLKHYSTSLIERVIAAIVLALLSPLYLLMKCIYSTNRLPVVLLPASESPEDWKIFDWVTFVPQEGKTMNSGFCLFRKLPVLFSILKGEVHFVGVQPRTKTETLNLPQDWKNLYLRSKIGVITLAALDNSYPTEDEQYASEVYYATHMGYWYDIKLGLRYLFSKVTKLFLKENK